ncbi:uncharacterized protein LOC9644985 isoform X2 [Selaginella moellendorffii]|uniref:uncharacterized protein LOC9644985 isoform X2 n=1 Tax=Selaginella moellendorffii TaxID=88036 RepID=UPI000D1CB99C|nr:uncharacterized protein LOC9644985 isoform X2 [Selaginella moellendorffii]|eukprot:XP_024545498.1 uncharacterized protein LOC9644985 isoform X2 [Selaginella moellendorffii]
MLVAADFWRASGKIECSSMRITALHFPGIAGFASLRGIDRRRRPRFCSRRQRFCSGAASIGCIPGPGLKICALEQGTEEWLEIRKDRLTASTFANALGFFKGKRIELWEEKVGLRGAFKGNQATRWGVENESAAVESYKRITGHLVDHIGFKIYKEDEEQQTLREEKGGREQAEKFSWLGASPDGLIEGNESDLFEKKGILEVKCPHMRGRRNAGVPWTKVPHYYVPQLQGLLEIIGREWMDFYVWTGKSSACFRVTKDPEYWTLIHGLLSEFWWENVIPARKAQAAGETNLDAFKPGAEHPKTGAMIKKSKELARAGWT